MIKTTFHRYIRLATGGRMGQEPEATEGYAINCQGIDLVVHRSNSGQYWSVSEPQTGLAYGSEVYDTRKAAIEGAAAITEKVTPAGIRKFIKDGLAYQVKAVA